MTVLGPKPIAHWGSRGNALFVFGNTTEFLALLTAQTWLLDFFFTYLRSGIFFLFSITYWTKMSTVSVKYEKLSLGTNCHRRMVKKIIWNSLWNPCVAYLTIEGYFPNTTELKLLSHLLRFSRASSGHQALKRVRFLCLIPLLDLAYSHLCLIFFPS